VLSALALAVLAAIEPLGIIAFIAVLASRGGRRNTRGFVVGWMLCACVVALVTVLIAGGDGRVDRGSTSVGSAGWLQIALGIVAAGYLVARRRRVPVSPGASGTGEKEDNLGPVGAALIAAALQGWPVVAAAVAAVLKSTDDTTGRLLGTAAVIVVASSTYMAAHVLAGRRPERTAAWLARLRSWIEAHRDRAIDLLLLAAACYLIVHGVLAQIAK
jgi:hypothetical protein